MAEAPGSMFPWEKDNEKQQELVCRTGYKELLRKNRVELRDKLHLCGVWAHLRQLDVLDITMEQFLRSNAPEYQVVERLLDLIETGPAWWFHALMRACALTNQDYLITVLGLDPQMYHTEMRNTVEKGLEKNHSMVPRGVVGMSQQSENELLKCIFRAVRGFLARQRLAHRREEVAREAPVTHRLLEFVEAHNRGVKKQLDQRVQDNKNIPKGLLKKGDKSPPPFILSPTAEQPGAPSTPNSAPSAGSKRLTYLLKQAGQFPKWFHGIIPLKEAERLLQHKPTGCFLIWVSERRLGYSLSFKAEDRCRHYMIDQTPSGKYVIIGEPRVHKSLNDMVAYYKKTALSNWTRTLGEPCGQEDGQCDYWNLLDAEDRLYIDINIDN